MNVTKIILSVVVAMAVVISGTIWGVTTVINNKTEEVQAYLQQEIKNALEAQKVAYEEKIQKVTTQMNEQAIEHFEKALQSAETTYKAYSSEYVKNVINRAAKTASIYQKDKNLTVFHLSDKTSCQL